MNSEILIKKGDVCNLSRLPLSMDVNPCSLTAQQIINQPDIDYRDTALYKHYRSFNLKTMADFFNVDDVTLNKFSYDNIFLPWIHTRPVTDFHDHAFLYQPDDKLIKKEFTKIKDLIKSFREFGYSPEKFIDRKLGYVTGYYIQDVDSKKFYVVSGNHRTAVFFSLFPKDHLRVIYETADFTKRRDIVNNGWLRSNKFFPTSFNTCDIINWPAVKSGFITSQLAYDITLKYIGKCN